jgi:hypothetical protein
MKLISIIWGILLIPLMLNAASVGSINGVPAANVGSLNGLNWQSGTKTLGTVGGLTAEAAGPAWSSNQFTTAGSASADSEYSTNYDHLAIDGDVGTDWNSGTGACPHWWKYDLGSGYSHHINRVSFYNLYALGHAYIKNFTIEGSTNDSSWTTLVTSVTTDSTSLQTFDFTSNTTIYRYIRITVTDSWMGAGLGYTDCHAYGIGIYEIYGYYYE